VIQRIHSQHLLAARSVGRAATPAMPPRRSARVATAAERASGAFAPLPLAVTLHIFSLLPADARARAACVCRLFHATLADGQAWTALDVTAASGLARPATDARLRAAAARARGALTSLDVSSCAAITHATLLGVVTANAGALRRLRTHGCRWAHDLGGVRVLAAAAAPALHAFDTDVVAEDVAEARAALRREGELAPLRLRALATDCTGAPAEVLTSLAADVAAHASLTRLSLTHARLHTPGLLDTLVDALLTHSVASLALWECTFPESPAASLARLCHGGALCELSIISGFVAAGDAALLRAGDAAGAAKLAAALAGNAALSSLTLMGLGLWGDAPSAVALLAGLTGHPRLHTLKLPLNALGDAATRGAAGDALGALVAANAPALTDLDVSYCALSDEGLRPLCDALPANTHLRSLDVRRSLMSAPFAADVLAPAVRANGSLRVLQAEHFLDSSPGARAAEAAVLRRTAAAAAPARG
jgi:hypothetical protein